MICADISIPLANVIPIDPWLLRNVIRDRWGNLSRVRDEPVELDACLATWDFRSHA